MALETEPSSSSRMSFWLLGLRDILFSVVGFLVGRSFSQSGSDSANKHIDTIRYAGEAEHQQGKQNISLNVTVRETEEVIRDRRAEADRQYRTQNSIRNATWAAFIAAAIYAGITALMWQDSKKHFAVDERAWMGATEAGNLVITEREVSFPIRVGVTGKTPAKDVRVICFLEKAIEGMPLKLNPLNVPLAKPSNFLVHGFMFPGQTADLTVYRLDGNANHIPFSPDDLKELQTGKAFVIIYGDIIYSDIFGTRHWTQFCTWKTLMPGNYHAAECSAHNNAD